VNESTTRHPNQFLSDLTAAMRATAEAAERAILDQCASDAAARIEQLHARTELGAKSLQDAAMTDVTTIRGQSKAHMEAIRAETERLIADRRDSLERQLQGLDAAVERETATVQERVNAYEAELSRFFERLLEGADPTVFATMASQMPDAPVFERNPEVLESELQPIGDASPEAAVAPEANADEPKSRELPDHWWLDSPASLAARTR
jgi:hypothetical protein